MYPLARILITLPSIHGCFKLIFVVPNLVSLVSVILDDLCVVDGPVVFTYGQIGALVLVQLDHQLIKLQLQLLTQQQGKVLFYK